jgi:hypothetical protein
MLVDASRKPNCCDDHRPPPSRQSQLMSEERMRGKIKLKIDTIEGLCAVVMMDNENLDRMTSESESENAN